MIKNSKGITLVSLVITIAIMLIISGLTISVSMDRFEINDYNKMINDLKLLEDKVSNYYLKYNAIPVVRDEENNPILYNYTEIPFNTNRNDNEDYYILDLSAMEGISLNYGETGFKNINSSDDVYIINEKSHQIYYVKGVELKGTTYHSIVNNDVINDNIPPSKPSVKIVSGTLNHDGTYMTDVELEFLPGKSEGKTADKTEYSLDGGSTWTDINALTNNIYKITSDGTYDIKVRSYDAQANISEYETNIITEIIRIGDKVEYNEASKDSQPVILDTSKGAGTTATKNTATQEFTMQSDEYTTEDLEWRILSINNGQIELISTNPTITTVCLAGEDGYLNAESKFEKDGTIREYGTLDEFCNKLYGYGIGAVGARSLNVNDVNELITTGYNPTTYSGYGVRWQYRYSGTQIQYRNSVDGGTTWNPDWTNCEVARTQFKEPNKNLIDSTTKEDRVSDLIYTSYLYKIEDKVTDKIENDTIQMSDFIMQGEKMSGKIKQWLASTSVGCNTKHADFCVRILDGGYVRSEYLWYSHVYGDSANNYIRPVVTLKKDIKLTKVNSVWQISQ